MTDYLTLAEVLAMHADQIERYGGSHGVREIRGCSKPLSQSLRKPPLWESPSRNHAFIDSNKRTAFAATYTFLVINLLAISFLAIDGARRTADSGDIYAIVAAICDANQFSFDKLVAWLRSHATM
jgi:death-on-curing protein